MEKEIFRKNPQEKTLILAKSLHQNSSKDLVEYDKQTPSKFSNKKPIKAKDESVIFSKRTEIEPKSIFISHKMQKQTVTLPLEIKSIS